MFIYNNIGDLRSIKKEFKLQHIQTITHSDVHRNLTLGYTLY